MFKLIVLLTLLANFGCILTNPTLPDATIFGENDSSSFSSSSSSSNSSFSQASSSESNVNNSENTSDSLCSEDTEPPIINPEPEPVVKPDPPVTTTDPPVTTTDPPVTTTDPPTTTPDQLNTSISSRIEDFNKGNTKFTARFFNDLVQKNPGKSLVMSVYSTLFLMALLGYFAVGPTQTELLSPMNFKNKDEIPLVIPAILDSIREQTKVQLTLVSKTYGSIEYKFSDKYETDSQRILGATCESLNFSDPEQSAAIINKWVADNTNEKIQNLVSPSLLKPDTQLVLTNAFYFLGEWLHKFNNASTISSKFYKSDNTTVMVDTMNQVKYFKYAGIDNLNAQALELPYVNNNLTCLILLPRETDGVATLVKNLVEDNKLNSVVNSLEYKRINVFLPKFKTTTSTDLKEIYQKLGITSMFDPQKSGLTGIMADPTVRILVTAAIQKAAIEVNEAGSEAAAATAFIGVGITSVQAPPPPPIPFIADHGFIYYLLLHGTPIFCGYYAGN